MNTTQQNNIEQNSKAGDSDAVDRSASPDVSNSENDKFGADEDFDHQQFGDQSSNLGLDAEETVVRKLASDDTIVSAKSSRTPRPTANESSIDRQQDEDASSIDGGPNPAESNTKAETRESAPNPASNEKVSAASPRFWHGMRFGTYAKLIIDGRFRLSFLGIGMFLAVCVFSVLNSFLAGLQWLFFGWKISKTELKEPPVFIVGHWRSGTTLMHEMLTADEQFAAPSTFQCFAANHFLLSERWLKPIVRATMPKTRPMDNMATGPDQPQEDEFGICTLGAPSPYRAMAFPNMPRPHQELIDMKNVDPRDKSKFAKTLKFFYKLLTVKHKKRLLLKSPTHTGRIEFLREQFPGAKFVHITRNPHQIIPSTIRLWQKLDRINGFQIPTYSQEWLEGYVLKTFGKIHQAFTEQTADDSNDICTIAYEDLISDPAVQVEKVYQALQLGDFDNVKPRILEFMDARKGYKTNRFEPSTEQLMKIDEHCSAYQQLYGYKKTGE